MVAAGELVLIPVFSPVSLETPDSYPDRRNKPYRSMGPRVYRLPPKIQQPRLSYSFHGHTHLQDQKGRIIDLYA